MEIGKPRKTVIVVPKEADAPTPAPKQPPAREEEPEKVPAGE